MFLFLKQIVLSIPSVTVELSSGMVCQNLKEMQISQNSSLRLGSVRLTLIALFYFLVNWYFKYVNLWISCKTVCQTEDILPLIKVNSTLLHYTVLYHKSARFSPDITRRCSDLCKLRMLFRGWRKIERLAAVKVELMGFRSFSNMWESIGQDGDLDSVVVPNLGPFHSHLRNMWWLTSLVPQGPRRGRGW